MDAFPLTEQRFIKKDLLFRKRFFMIGPWRPPEMGMERGC